jgi:hypothetical protein
MLKFFRKQGKRGGKLSAAARMEILTPEQRQEIARKAGLASAAARARKKAAPTTDNQGKS